MKSNRDNVWMQLPRNELFVLLAAILARRVANPVPAFNFSENDGRHKQWRLRPEREYTRAQFRLLAEPVSHSVVVQEIAVHERSSS
jgi:hypothetical protein